MSVRGFFSVFSNWLAPLSYQLYRYIDLRASCRFFSIKDFIVFPVAEFLHHNCFYFDWYVPPASLYHWRSPSPEENNFIHWLHLILHSTVERVCRGGNKLYIPFCRLQVNRLKSISSICGKREELGSGQLLHKEGKPPKSASIVWHWRGEMEEWKIWATGVSLSGFSKWLPLGVKSSLTSAIIMSIYPLMKVKVMVTLDGFC